MSVTVPLNTGKARSGGSTSLSVSFGSLPTSGDAIIVVTASGGGGGSSLNASEMTDNQGGSGLYTVDSHGALNPDGVERPGVWSRLNTSSPSGTFTVTFTPSEGSSVITMGAISARSLATSSAVDQVRNTGTGSSNAPATGVTGTTEQGDELLVAVADISGSGTITITDPGDTGITSIFNEGDDVYAVGSGVYRILNTTDTYSCTWGLSASRDWSACLCTYKGEAGGGWEPQADATEKLITIATPRWRS